jgi:PIN domain nuclease of toxin-antitoxin system
VKALIDTQIFLWFVSGDKKLSKTAKAAITHPDNEIYLSIVSLWEISIKTALGKLEIKGDYESVIDDVVQNGIQILPINFAHTVIQNQLPFYHRDPFDRIIVSQAIVEGMSLISKDQIFDQYLKDQSINRIE